MKFSGVLIVLCATVAYVQSEGTVKNEIKEFGVECMKETGATQADVDLVAAHLPAVTTEAKCLRACVSKKMGIMTPDGKMDKEGVLKLVKTLAKGDTAREKLGIQVAETCAALEISTDLCEASEQLHTCYAREAKANGWGDLDE